MENNTSFSFLPDAVAAILMTKEYTRVKVRGELLEKKSSLCEHCPAVFDKKILELAKLADKKNVSSNYSKHTFTGSINSIKIKEFTHFNEEIHLDFYNSKTIQLKKQNQS